MTERSYLPGGDRAATSEADGGGSTERRLLALEQELAPRTAERDSARDALHRRAAEAGQVPNPEGNALGGRLFTLVGELQRLSEELEERNTALAQSNWDLERRVAERTAALEAALDAKRRSEARFRAIAHHIPQLVWTSHPEGRWDFSNQRWQEYTGQSQEESQGLGWLSSVHPDDRDRTMAAWHDAVLRNGRLLVEHRLRGQDGGYRWFETQALPTDADQRDPESDWIGSSTDIHARKLTEAALTESKTELEQALEVRRQEVADSKARFRTFFAISSEALFVVEVAPGGRYLHEALNPPFERMTGLRAEDAQGRRAAEFLPAGTAEVLEGHYRGCAERGAPCSFDAVLDLPVGRRVLRIALVPTGTGGDGGTQYLLGSARDVGNEEYTPA